MAEIKLTMNPTEERKQEIYKWCADYKKKFPKMKDQRILKKAVAYFKLK